MENRHQPYDLAQMQSLPLEAKIRMTKERIEGWYESWCKFEIYDTATEKTRFVTIDRRDYRTEPPMKDTECVMSVYPGQVYVSFSGGKDSTVLKHIVDSMYDDVPAVFVNTGLEYPEIQKFAMSQKNVITVRPEMRFDEVLTVHGYPGTEVIDFLKVRKEDIKTDFSRDIITNPPYKYAKEFIAKALDISMDGTKIAMFLKVQFLEGKARRELFEKYPPKKIYISSSRLLCAKNGEFEKDSSRAVAYAWFVRVKGYKGEPIVRWFN